MLLKLYLINRKTCFDSFDKKNFFRVHKKKML